jgi:hypothetical protein
MAVMCAGVVTLLGGIIVVILPTQWLRVKTLDLVVSMVAVLCIVFCIGASSWSPNITPYRFVVFCGKLWFFRVFFSLSLICFVKSYPHHLVLVPPLWLYCEAGENMFRGEVTSNVK